MHSHIHTHAYIQVFCDSLRRAFHAASMGGSRKHPYPYHGRHLGIPKGRGVTSTGIPRTWGGYVDWNSEDMGRVHWTGIPKAYGGFQESNFQFGVVKSLQEKLVKNDISKDVDSLLNTRHVQLNQHAGDTFQW